MNTSMLIIIIIHILSNQKRSLGCQVRHWSTFGDSISYHSPAHVIRSPEKQLKRWCPEAMRPRDVCYSMFSKILTSACVTLPARPSQNATGRGAEAAENYAPAVPDHVAGRAGSSRGRSPWPAERPSHPSRRSSWAFSCVCPPWRRRVRVSSSATAVTLETGVKCSHISRYWRLEGQPMNLGGGGDPRPGP